MWLFKVQERSPLPTSVTAQLYYSNFYHHSFSLTQRHPPPLLLHCLSLICLIGSRRTDCFALHSTISVLFAGKSPRRCDTNILNFHPSFWISFAILSLLGSGASQAIRSQHRFPVAISLAQSIGCPALSHVLKPITEAYNGPAVSAPLITPSEDFKLPQLWSSKHRTELLGLQAGGSTSPTDVVRQR